MNSTSPIFSIIVPIYNTANYLHRCIDSILSQGFTDFEALLIDDGSTDNSGEICDTYAKQDNRIKVFHKKNEGVSAARNFGLENAQGEWLIFVDSDDWVEYNLLDIVSRKIQLIDADLYTFGIRRVSDKTIHYEYIPPCAIEKNISFIKSRYYQYTSCTYVFKNAIIKEYNITFPIELKRAEDQAFLLKYISQTDKIVLIDRVLYNYYDNPNSAVNQPADNSWAMSNILAANNFLEFCKRHNVSEAFYEYRVNQLYEDFFIYYKMIKNINRRDIKKEYQRAYKQSLQVYPELKRKRFYNIAYYNLTLSVIFYHRKKQVKDKLKKIKDKLYIFLNIEKIILFRG